jgi:RNA recognition motif-containing protein
MSLFVGNISRNVRMSQLEDAFEKYGRCSIRQNVSFFQIIILYRGPLLSLNTMMNAVQKTLSSIYKEKIWEALK